MIGKIRLSRRLFFATFVLAACGDLRQYPLGGDGGVNADAVDSGFLDARASEGTGGGSPSGVTGGAGVGGARTGGIGGGLMASGGGGGIGATAGNAGATGGATGGMTGGGSGGIGGTVSASGGGRAGSGGSLPATGGATAGIGGAPPGTGGRINSTGGAVSSSGGTTSTGGAPGTGGATGSSGGAGGGQCPSSVTGPNCDIPRFEPAGPSLEHNGITAVNGDGTVFAGFSYDINENVTPFVWTRGRGTEALLAAQAVLGWSMERMAISRDGSVIVGTFHPESTRAFRWTASGRAIPLGALPGGNASYGTDVNADGAVIVGGANKGTSDDTTFVYYPFRWTQETNTLEEIPGLVEGARGWAHAVSDSGKVVVGESRTAGGSSNAFIWTVGSARPQNLGGVSGAESSVASDVSADGLIAVGTSTRGAFRWSLSTGMTDITAATGWTSTGATATNSDGSIIIGTGSAGPWIWDPTNGARLLRTILSGMGVNLTGWTLRKAYALSADGKTIAGSGAAPSGFDRSYIVRLP